MGAFGRLIVLLITSLFSKQKLKAFVANPNAKDLAVLTGYVERGEIRPILHGRFPLAETAKALALLGEGRSQGSTVVTVAG